MSTDTPNKPPEEDISEISTETEHDRSPQSEPEEIEVHIDPQQSTPQARAAHRSGPSREQLIDTINKLRDEAKASRERMLRIAADADNLRKRVLKERRDIEKFSQENLLRDLLIPLDNLERTLAHIPGEDQNPALKSLAEGIDMVLQQFWSVLSSHHLNKVDASKGEMFDPNLHEAINRKETNEFPSGTILSVMQRGYQLHDRLLRPAMVEVACSTDTPGEPQKACSDPDQTSLDEFPSAGEE